MKQNILCINGSDSSGLSGIQADIHSAVDFGVTTRSAITSITAQNVYGIRQIHSLPTELVVGQVRSAFDEEIPQAIKIGLVNNPDTITGIRDEIIACKNVVCSPVILASGGGCLMSNDSLHAFATHLLPITRLLILKSVDAEILLGRNISSDEDMRMACSQLLDMGAEWVLLRAGSYINGQITAMLCGKDYEHFFSSVNVKDWKQHGVGSTLSTAITCRMAMGDDVPSAIQNAHSYIRNKVMTSAGNSNASRPTELYNQFLSLLADHYQEAHDVWFYASNLIIGTRYFSKITNDIAGKSPKQIIDEFLIGKIEQRLRTTNLTLQQIAAEFGFSSQNTFSKFFSQRTGMSPSEYRRM